MIHFDDLPPGTRVTTQYPGVVFPGGGRIERAADFGLATRSAPNLLTKECGEFDEPPFPIHFTSPQAFVRVYVGNPEHFRQRAVLRAYNSPTKGELVGSAEVTLAPRADVITALEICRFVERDIWRVELLLDPGCEVIDDLRFDDGADLGPITTVNFDDRNEFTRITRQYPGLNFIDAPWVRRASSLGTATISPPNVLEPFSFGFEFDVDPLRVVLDPPQAWVRTYVGNPSYPARVEMRAYSLPSGGVPLATVFADFSGPAPVGTPLEICRFAEGDIRRIEIFNDQAAFEAIDNFQFAGQPPPPPPTDPQPPRVFIDVPGNGDFFFVERVDLRGRIFENLGLQQVILTQTQLDGPGRREDATFLRFVRGAPPVFTFDSDLFLFPGRNHIRIQAFDTSNNPSSNPESEVIVTLAPPMEVFIDTPQHDPRRAPPVFASSPIQVEGRVRKAFGTLPRERLSIRVSSGSAGSRGSTPVDEVTGAPPEFRFRATVPLLSGLINEGNTITVEALSEDGQRRNDSVFVVFSLPDLSIPRIEVTQATFGLPVADKRTVARVYPLRAPWLGGGDVSVRRVELIGRRGGVPLPGSPLIRDLPITARQVFVPSDVNNSWNIQLPASWDDEGDLELIARLNGDGAVLECGRCSANNESRVTVRFTSRNPFNVVPVLLSVNGSQPPDRSTIPPSFTGVQRLYPTATVNIRPAVGLSVSASIFGDLNSPDRDDADDAMGELAERIADQYTCYDGEWYGSIFDWIDGCSWDTYYYGMVQPFLSARVGMAVAPGVVTDDIVTPDDGPAAWGWAGYPLRAAAHELGHCLGRRHTPGHDEEGAELSPPHGALIHEGFDTVAMQVIPQWRASGWPPGIPTICDPGCNVANLGPHAHDFMSYGPDPMWISHSAWLALFRKNFRGERSADPLRQVSSAGAAESPRRFMAIQGRLRDGRVSILKPFQVATLPEGVGVRTMEGGYRVEAQDVSGIALASARFEPTHLTERASDSVKSFSVVLPYPEGVTQIVIFDPQGLVIAQRQASRNEPVVRILQPNGGEVWTALDTQTIAWSGSDADGDALTYAVQYSKDGGATWQMVASQLAETSYDLDASWIPGSDQGKVRVIASDGVHTTRDESDGTFTVERKPPQVFVLSPEDGARLDFREPISFEGTATDHEDQEIANDSLEWSSDVDGPLGTGRRLDIDELSPGAHTIFLSATDSDGFEGKASVTVFVPAGTVKESVGGLDGWVDNRGRAETQTRIFVGNGLIEGVGVERLLRGFLSFDLADVPAGSEIVEARLELYQSSVTGTPYRAQAHDREVFRRRRIAVEAVDYGSQLDGEDFDSPALGPELGTLADNGLQQYKSLDVREAVRKAVEEQRRLVQFRLRLVNESDGDGQVDIAEFESSLTAGPLGNAPRLVIVHGLPQ